MFIVLLSYFTDPDSFILVVKSSRFENKHERPDVGTLFGNQPFNLTNFPAANQPGRLTKHDFATMILTKKCWTLRVDGTGKSSRNILMTVLTVLLAPYESIQTLRGNHDARYADIRYTDFVARCAA